jgi:hypothetical protein
LGAPFSEGFVRSRYECLISTNIGGISIPKEFLFEVFFPVYDPNEKQPPFITLGKRYHFKVTDIRSGLKRSTFLPAVSGRTIVTDQRFVGDERVPAFRYEIANAWLSREEAKGTSEYSAALDERELRHSRMSAPVPPVGLARIIATVGILFIALTPVYFLARQWPRGDQKEKP